MADGFREQVGFEGVRWTRGPWTIIRKYGNSVLDIYFSEDGNLTTANHIGYSGTFDAAVTICDRPSPQGER